MPNPIFSFGTLQLEQVQQSLFGRSVPTAPDSLYGFTIGETRITDPEAIAASGTDLHPALVETGIKGDVVPGAILAVTDDELAAADHYERVSFRRIPVILASGTGAWAYLPR